MIGARRDERKPQKCSSTLVPRPRVPRTACWSAGASLFEAISNAGDWVV